LALALVPVLGVRAGASGPSPDTMVAVAQGVNVNDISGASAFGTTPPNTPETVAFVLDERNLSQLEQSVEQGISSYLSVSAFASEYGQTQSNISQLQSYLSGFGISTQVYADDVDVVANGTAGQFDQALSTQQSQYHVPGTAGGNGWQSVASQNVHGASTSPELPYRIAQYVDAVLGLTNYAPFTSHAVHAAEVKNVTTAGLSSSACVTLTTLPDACNTPTNFESNYGLSSLESSSAGRGSTIGIVTLAALDQGAPEYFWSNIMHLPNVGRKVTVDNIDGGPGAPTWDAGSSETDLDVEQSGGVAPGANVIVYQAPNTDFGFADAFFEAASQNVADSVSTSWGDSETYYQSLINSGLESPGLQSSSDEAFLELAAQGQSAFDAAGDDGAYDANDDVGSTNLSVDSPADSPYITAGGGTTLPWSATFTDSSTGLSAPVQVTSQRAWGWDYLWQPIATITKSALNATFVEVQGLIGGGGGGFSTFESEPSYQQGVSGTQSYTGVQWLTPTTPENVGDLIEPTQWTLNDPPRTVTGSGTGRAVPDLSVDADPETGYLEWSPSFVQGDVGPELEGGWGGTSFVGPQLNGTTAVIDAALGHRVGFWNPTIYALATSHNSPFTPLQQVGTSDDNLFYTGNAGDVYNEATGLGVPNLGALAHDFAG
jgi:subtilase family serine protease